jgi:hypothetical protein
MLEDIDGETHPTISIHNLPNSHSTLQDLLRAVEIGCYICLNIHDQMDAENAIAHLDMDNHLPLLLRKAGKDRIMGEVCAMICTNPQMQELRAFTWSYILIDASRHDEQFGFDFALTGSDPTRAVHRMHQDIPSSTNSPTVGALARSWYQSCKSDHIDCSNSESCDTLDLRKVAAYGSDVYPYAKVNSPQRLRWYPRVC